MIALLLLISTNFFTAGYARQKLYMGRTGMAQVCKSILSGNTKAS